MPTIEAPSTAVIGPLEISRLTKAPPVSAMDCTGIKSLTIEAPSFLPMESLVILLMIEAPSTAVIDPLAVLRFDKAPPIFTMDSAGANSPKIEAPSFLSMDSLAILPMIEASSTALIVPCAISRMIESPTAPQMDLATMINVMYGRGRQPVAMADLLMEPVHSGTTEASSAAPMEP